MAMRHATQPARPGTRFISAAPVPDIAPVDGWTLCEIFPQTSSDRCREYVARGPEFDLHLDVSRFRSAFFPTQARFDWLVRNGFPPRPNSAYPWDYRAIDFCIAAERRAVAA